MGICPSAMHPISGCAPIQMHGCCGQTHASAASQSPTLGHGQPGRSEATDVRAYVSVRCGKRQEKRLHRRFSFDRALSATSSEAGVQGPRSVDLWAA
eukprot:5876586-Pyramimonas_sp.AAC.1